MTMYNVSNNRLDQVYDAKESDWEDDDDNYKSGLPENLRWRNWAVDTKDGKSLTGDDLLNFVNNALFPTLKNLELPDSTPIKQAVVKEVFSDINQYMKNGTILRQVINEIDKIKFETAKEKNLLSGIYEKILKDLQSAEKPLHLCVGQLTETVAYFACGTDGFLTSALNCLERKVTEYTEGDKFSVIAMNPPYGGNELNSIQTNFPKDLRSSETADLFTAIILYRLKYEGCAAVIIPDVFLRGRSQT